MMSNQSENNKRIAKNTLMLYVRMLFSMIVSLYTSRVILNMLGVEDYGIYNVVGGFVSMFAIISSALSAATSRFITFELGKKDGNPGKVFSNALFIHLVLAAIVLLAFETFGLWFLNEKMVIPEHRMPVANYVFQASVLAFIISIIGVPFTSAVIAHERMDTFAFLGVLEVVMKLVFVIFVAYAPFNFDKLVVFPTLMIGMGICIQLSYWFFCRRHFEECRCRPKFDKGYFRDMFSFSVWNFIGCTAAILKGQGINMLLNLFFGTVINAAYGVASTVNSAVSGFAGNFMTALNPQITKSYASGDKEYMFSLIDRGSRFSFYLILIFAIPLMLETDHVLAIWLGDYPEYSVAFVRLMLAVSLIDIISNTLITSQNATGKIRNYQLAVGGMLMMNFPFSYLALKLGYSPSVVFVVAMFVGVACLLLRLIFLRKMIGLSMSWFFKTVLLRILFVALSASVIPLAVHFAMPYGWPRTLTVVAVSVVLTAFVILYAGCSRNERQSILLALKKKLRRA